MAVQTFVVAGGTGFIGSALCERLAADGNVVKVLTRHPWPNAGSIQYIQWDPKAIVGSKPDNEASAALARELETADAVINLSGESVASGRWSKSRKRLILESRLRSTQALVGAMRGLKRRPPVLINASATGYYGPTGDQLLDESSPPGGDFLADVCRQWEAQAYKAQTMDMRVACLRIGVVLGTRGGALARMLPPFRLGLGGPLGSGAQWMSWIHIDDLVRMVLWIVSKPDLHGVFNGTSPEPVRNREFSQTLARVLGKPCVFKVPALLLRLGAGEMSTILLNGQRVIPRAVLAAGFKFQSPDIEPALRSLLAK